MKEKKTEVILIRHGETEWNQSGKFQGNIDINLNEEGKKQADILASYFKKNKFDRIYSSPLTRSLTTAQKIASYHSSEVIKLSSIREFDFGDWEGSDYNEIRNKYPDLVEQWYQNPESVEIPRGENLDEFQKRVKNGFNEIISGNQGNKIIVVTHGGVIRIWISYLLNIPYKSFFKIEIDNASISKVIYYEDYPILNSLNQSVQNKI